MLQRSIFASSQTSTYADWSTTMLTAEQVLSTQKNNAEVLFGLTNKAFEGVEKLVELNLQATKAATGKVIETAKSVLSVKDAQELLALQAGLLQPAAEKATAYSRTLYELAATTIAEAGKVAEAAAAEAQTKFVAVVDTAVKNAPAGSETAVAFVKSAVAAANNAYEGAIKAAKQAADVADGNFRTVTATATKATPTAPKGKRATA
jgi:phasin family protein